MGTIFSMICNYITNFNLYIIVIINIKCMHESETIMGKKGKDKSEGSGDG